MTDCCFNISSSYVNQSRIYSNDRLLINNYQLLIINYLSAISLLQKYFTLAVRIVRTDCLVLVRTCKIDLSKLASRVILGDEAANGWAQSDGEHGEHGEGEDDDDDGVCTWTERTCFDTGVKFGVEMFSSFFASLSILSDESTAIKNRQTIITI